jgi:hypothetical protein
VKWGLGAWHFRDAYEVWSKIRKIIDGGDDCQKKWAVTGKVTIFDLVPPPIRCVSVRPRALMPIKLVDKIAGLSIIDICCV